MPSRAPSRCTAGCGTLVPTGGRCTDCTTKARAAADAKRGSPARRGYDRNHITRFRTAVLQQDPVCVLCRTAPATEADHHPLSRRQLAAQGYDPNDPRYGRGLCHHCHTKETARHQPGGFNPGAGDQARTTHD